jgi:hypothetical protein
VLWLLKLSPGNDKVIAVAHSAYGLHDFTLVVFDDLDAFQVLPQRKQVSEHFISSSIKHDSWFAKVNTHDPE